MQSYVVDLREPYEYGCTVAVQPYQCSCTGTVQLPVPVLVRLLRYTQCVQHTVAVQPYWYSCTGTVLYSYRYWYWYAYYGTHSVYSTTACTRYVYSGTVLLAKYKYLLHSTTLGSAAPAFPSAWRPRARSRARARAGRRGQARLATQCASPGAVQRSGAAARCARATPLSPTSYP